MPIQEDTRRALEAAERAALRAGELVMKGWRVGTEIARKGRFDLLTKYDLESENLIREALSREFPSHRIVGEEGAETGEGELVWYVDPIDGTTNFAHGHFFFAVSIALYRGREGLVGLVHAPALGVTWKAARGMGAFRNGKPCSVSTREQLEEAVCATGFPYDRWSNGDNNHAELALFLAARQRHPAVRRRVGRPLSGRRRHVRHLLGEVAQCLGHVCRRADRARKRAAGSRPTKAKRLTHAVASWSRPTACFTRLPSARFVRHVTISHPTSRESGRFGRYTERDGDRTGGGAGLGARICVLGGDAGSAGAPERRRAPLHDELTRPTVPGDDADLRGDRL